MTPALVVRHTWPDVPAAQPLWPSTVATERLPAERPRLCLDHVTPPSAVVHSSPDSPAIQAWSASLMLRLLSDQMTPAAFTSSQVTPPSSVRRSSGP